MLLCDSCVIIKFLGINLFLLGHELANSLYLFRQHTSFLQTIQNFSLRQRLHFFANIII